MKINCMIIIFIGCLLFGTVESQAQNKDAENGKEVVTTGILDTNLTKSGYRINEYYIELSDSLYEVYRGKKIEITGKLLIVKALDVQEKNIAQGALHDRYFITEPKIRIIYNR